MKIKQNVLLCPKCESEDLDPVPYVYQSLKSKGAGRKIFRDEEVLETIETKELTPQERERLIKRLTPPPEPKKSLPAGAIAIMAFVLSWLITGSLLIGRIGQKTYFIISIIIIVTTAYPFFVILHTVDRKFRKSVAKYNRIKPLWNRQYFCNECQHVFLPKRKS